MNLDRNRCLAAMAVSLAVIGMTSSAQAGLVIWNIDSAASLISLKIADASILAQSGENTIPVTLQFRNPTGSSSSWNIGNKAGVGGVIATNYSEEIDNHKLQFLHQSIGNIVGLNSGNFRPNPAAFDPELVSPSNPNGSYLNTTAAASVFGARIRSTALGLINADAAQLSLTNVSYQAQSPELLVTETTGGSFAAAGIDFGILHALENIDGLVVSFYSKPFFSDAVSVTTSTTIQPNSAASDGTITDLGGLNRRLTLPINTNVILTVDGYEFTTNISGQIVAYAVVPEPSTFALLALGATFLVGGAWKRRR